MFLARQEVVIEIIFSSSVISQDERDQPIQHREACFLRGCASCRDLQSVVTSLQIEPATSSSKPVVSVTPPAATHLGFLTQL